MKRPLLTIAIPTWNRCRYLEQNLSQLAKEAASVDTTGLEILISDNGSEDETPAVVAGAAQTALPIRYIRNVTNIGSDANIAQCFDLARGDYVLILGDDDLLVDGCLKWLWPVLETRQHGVINLRAYGFDSDFRREFPGAGGKAIAFQDASTFLAHVNSRMTLISSSVLHKAGVPELEANVFCGGNLVQVHLVLEVALRSRSNLSVESYRIACKRNNSGGYSFSKVFVQEFGRVLDQYRDRGLSREGVRAIETRMMIGYLPFYLLRQRLGATGTDSESDLRARLGDRLLFWIWLYPICALPRPAALVWGSAVTALGRVGSGDFRRGVRYLSDRIERSISPRSADV